MRDFSHLNLTYIKGIGPKRAELLKKELGVETALDLLMHYPVNYLDRTQITHIANFYGEEMNSVQIKGRFISFNTVGEGAKSRLTAIFSDGTALLEVVWFRKIKEIRKIYDLNKEYILFGSAKKFHQKWSIIHPEIDVPEAVTAQQGFRSVYPLTEKLRNAGINSRILMKWISVIISEKFELPEVIPLRILKKRNFPSRTQALKDIHFPTNKDALNRARERMKYEELYFLQLDIIKYTQTRNKDLKGYRFVRIGEYFNNFYRIALPFQLTEAQKRVIREIRQDVNSGRQMNRLLQGDVGSGKTMVALMVMLIALDNGFQACLMAPTEILAQQHFETLKELASQCGVTIALLTGSTRKKEREEIHDKLLNGDLQILVGTHALIEDTVQFKQLGLAIIDEQHRFGVVQRAKLWKKNHGQLPPHVLVMTATPIPRTLAMTVYGDLEVSVIDELPPGRKPIETVLRYENQRNQVYASLGRELAKGRQAYIVYPLIEENEKLDLKSLEEGYELIKDTFPHYKVAMVHGRMKQAEKDWQMQLFASGQANILVATTVIEVGVNVPNATTMIIENAERFGLSQLHQLRGRVGRGGDQSHCILMSKIKIAKETRKRLEIMTSTTDGFVVAEADLKLRGPGDLEGTMQSGIAFDLKIASLATDGQILQIARDDAKDTLDRDPELILTENIETKKELLSRNNNSIDFSRIS